MASSMIDPNFPLVEVHRHLDGAMRLETILDLGRQHNIALPSFELEGLRPYVQVTDPEPSLVAFLAKFEWAIAVLADYDACYRIAYENIEDAAREGIDYIELRFSPWFMAEAHGLEPAGVTEATIAGAAAGSRDFGVKSNLIGIISRTYGAEIGHQELDALLAHRDKLVALDLAGDEVNYPGDLFLEHYKRGKDAGWHLIAHAGEAGGVPAIWQAIKGLGVERIGHGTRAVNDPALLDYLAEHKIGLEMNLTSNVQTSTVPSLADHPLKQLLDHGIVASINSDDPGISAIDLPYEYNVAAPAAGLTAADIHLAQRHALTQAFLSDAEKQQLIERKQA